MGALLKSRTDNFSVAVCAHLSSFKAGETVNSNANSEQKTRIVTLLRATERTTHKPVTNCHACAMSRQQSVGVAWQSSEKHVKKHKSAAQPHLKFLQRPTTDKTTVKKAGTHRREPLRPRTMRVRWKPSNLQAVNPTGALYELANVNFIFNSDRWEQPAPSSSHCVNRIAPSNRSATEGGVPSATARPARCSLSIGAGCLPAAILRTPSAT
jgi:hypothetical protein